MEAIVTTSPNVMHGAPCFAGTRVTIQSLFDHLETGYTVDGFLAEFPTVKRHQVIGLLEQLKRQAQESAVAADARNCSWTKTCRTEIAGHDVFTVAFMGWSGLENGKLLANAAAAGFDALISNDRGLEYERDQTTLPLAVIVLLAPTNTIEDVRLLYPALEAALSSLAPRSLVKVGP